MVTQTSTPRLVRPVVVLLGVLALSLNLRAALAGYPPLVVAVRDELGVSASVAGMVQSGAVLMMAVGSFTGSSFGDRWGLERALGVAVGLVAVGSLVRSIPTLGSLIGGTVLVGIGIGVAGVLLTGVVKEHLASRAGAVTGVYVVAMMIGSTAASAVAVPAAVALGGWSLSLAVWAVPAVLALAVWAPLAYRVGGGTRRAGRTALPWGDGSARLAACYLAGSSLMVYGWLTWLPAYYESLEWSARSAGALLAVWSVAHIPAALAIPALAERRRRWRFWSGLTLGLITAGTLGALVAPDPSLIGPWLWVTLIGLGSGAGFALGLTMIAWRTSDGAASAATSSLALGIGYTVAGLGPLLMGLLIDVSGFPAAILVLLVAAGGVAAAIVKIGDLPATALTATEGVTPTTEDAT